MSISGIYKIQSKVKPERIYIGSSVNIHIRWGRHLSDLSKNIHRSNKLQNHYNKYGGNDLCFSILLSCERIELIKHEQFFIDSYNPYFNNAKIAGSPMLGRRHSEESKLKMSQIMIGNKHGIGNKSGIGKKQSAEQIAKRVSKNTGKKRTEETKRKMSVWQKGKPKSEEAKINMSNAQKRSYLLRKDLLNKLEADTKFFS